MLRVGIVTLATVRNVVPDEVGNHTKFLALAKIGSETVAIDR